MKQRLKASDKLDFQEIFLVFFFFQRNKYVESLGQIVPIKCHNISFPCMVIYVELSVNSGFSPSYLEHFERSESLLFIF